MFPIAVAIGTYMSFSSQMILTIILIPMMRHREMIDMETIMHFIGRQTGREASYPPVSIFLPLICSTKMEIILVKLQW